MKTAGVVIDKWKLATFEKHLKAAGFTYVVEKGITPDTHTLKVLYNHLDKLRPVVEAAQAECKRSKLQ